VAAVAVWLLWGLRRFFRDQLAKFAYGLLTELLRQSFHHGAFATHETRKLVREVRTGSLKFPKSGSIPFRHLAVTQKQMLLRWKNCAKPALQLKNLNHNRI
jgi:hypothetical protein